MSNLEYASLNMRFIVCSKIYHLLNNNWKPPGELHFTKQIADG